MLDRAPPPPSRDPAPGPPPGLGRVALLTGGLLLVVAGVAVLAWALASAAGLVGGGGDDDPTMADAPALTTAPAQGGRTATEAYWMKNTLVPLSIAFVAADGRVVSVAAMTPCTADPCPSYPPAGPYRYAVELPAGAFEAAGVGAGDKVVATDPAALPRPV